MPYVYVRSEPRLWTVGHYTPDGEWVAESDHGTPEEAADRVRWLHGGRDEEDSRALAALRKSYALLADESRWTLLQAAVGTTPLLDLLAEMRAALVEGQP